MIDNAFQQIVMRASILLPGAFLLKYL